MSTSKKQESKVAVSNGESPAGRETMLAQPPSRPRASLLPEIPADFAPAWRGSIWITDGYAQLRQVVVEDRLDTRYQPIVNVGLPVSEYQGANRKYVDMTMPTRFVNLTSVADVSNVTVETVDPTEEQQGARSAGYTFLSANAPGVLQLDGVAVQNEQHVLLKNQSDPTQNGYYYVMERGSSSTGFQLLREDDYAGVHLYVVRSGDTLTRTVWLFEDGVTINQLFGGEGGTPAGPRRIRVVTIDDSSNTSVAATESTQYYFKRTTPNETIFFNFAGLVDGDEVKFTNRGEVVDVVLTNDVAFLDTYLNAINGVRLEPGQTEIFSYFESRLSSQSVGSTYFSYA